MALRIQTPTPPNEWCYQDQGEDFRYFTQRVFLGKNELPWAECTEEEKVAWEEEHKQEEPLPEETVELQETVQ